MPLPKALERLRSDVERLDARRERARERARGEPDSGCLYFALIDFVSDAETLDEMKPLVRIQRVVEPPGMIELSGALRNAALVPLMARYSGSISWEVAVEAKGFTDQRARNMTWTIVSALRVRTLINILVPVVADRSWSTIAAITDHSCDAGVIEDVPSAHRFGAEVRKVQPEDVAWVFEHLITFADLMERPTFRIALEAATTHPHQASARMAVAHLWSGIEALLGVQMELRYRVSAYAAALLEPRGTARLDIYKRMKKLYDFRSKAVHGSDIKEADLADHVREVHTLLARLIIWCVNEKRTPTEADLDGALFA